MAIEIAKNIVLALHIIGIASLLGGMLVQIKQIKPGTTRIIPAIMHGAWTMLATGLILVGMAYMGDGPGPNNAKIAVKLTILIVIFAIAMTNLRKEKLASWVIPSLMGLTVANILIATVWRSYH